jgi:hypothetical protein
MQPESYVVVEPSEALGGGVQSCTVTKTTETYQFGSNDTRNQELISKVDILLQEVEDLVSEFKEIKDSLKKMETGIFSKNDAEPRIIMVEEMDMTTAKQKVIEFMKEHKTSDIEELHENIRCDISILIKIIDELIAEGSIGGAD